MVVGHDELVSLIRAAVREALATRDRGPAEAPEWLDTAGAAALLGVTVRTARKLASTGQIPATKVGPKLLRFRRVDVVAYLERP